MHATLIAPCTAHMTHPQLVLINVSDHHTRTRANTPAAPSSGVKVLGALLGSQSGRTIDISNSFEVKFDVVDGSLVIDNPFLLKKQGQCEASRLWAAGRCMGLVSLALSTDVRSVTINRSAAGLCASQH